LVTTSSSRPHLIQKSPTPTPSNSPTSTWYDYWTGKQLPPSTPGKPAVDGVPPAGADLVPLTTTIHPDIATLPVFVRGGAILPIAPLTQSTAETPQGPLTLRIYAGPDCRGSLYLDDGHTYAYTRGDFLRMNFTCEVTPNTLTLNTTEQGSYKPWWNQIRLEIYGWQPHTGTATIEGPTTTLPVEQTPGAVVLTLPEAHHYLSIRIHMGVARRRWFQVLESSPVHVVA